MAFGNLEAAMKKWREEQERLSPGSTPEAPLPPEVQQEFASRFPEVDPTNYEVNVSDTTAKMNGRPESLPSIAPSTNETDEDPLSFRVRKGSPTDVSSVESAPIQPTSSKPVIDKEAEAILSTDNDKAAREAGLAALEKRRKLGIIPQLAAGFGDAVAMGVSAKGGNAASGSLQRMVERQDKELETGKKDIETKLRNDPNSDISKQYQALVAQFLQKEPSDPMVLGLTANQIAEKIPQIEKLASMHQMEEMKRLELDAQRVKQANEAQAKTTEETSKQELAATEAKQQADVVRQTIKDIMDKKLIGWDTAGPAGMKVFAPIDKPNLEAKLDTIKANIAFDKLNKLRQASPTGGAVGQVSDKDMVLLQSVLGSLSTDQSPEELKASLNNIDKIFRKFQGYGISSPNTPTSSNNQEAPMPEETGYKTKSGHSYRKVKRNG